MSEPVWLPIEAVIDYQAELIDLYGGAHGLRDRGLLESALARPRHLQAYGEPTLFALAGAYCLGLSQNHAFVDGNKRIAFAVMAAFLAVNGHYLDAREDEAFEAMMRIASGNMDEADLETWILANSTRD